MYYVEWSERALEDLLTKVKSERVATELRIAAEQALDDHGPYDPDGGVIGSHGTVFWRRGLTQQRRAELDAAEASGTDCDADREQAYQFRFVYHR